MIAWTQDRHNYDPGGVPSYRPTLQVGRSRRGRELAILADAYDRVQAARGDRRRAYRG
jgi:hypothetical protein